MPCYYYTVSGSRPERHTLPLRFDARVELRTAIDVARTKPKLQYISSQIHRLGFAPTKTSAQLSSCKRERTTTSRIYPCNSEKKMVPMCTHERRDMKCRILTGRDTAAGGIATTEVPPMISTTYISGALTKISKILLRRTWYNICCRVQTLLCCRLRDCPRQLPHAFTRFGACSTSR